MLYQWSAAAPFAATAACFAVVGLCVLAIRVPLGADPPFPPVQWRRELGSGLRELLARPRLRAITWLTLAGDVLFSDIGLVMIVLVRESGGSAATIGAVFSVAAAGTIVGSAVAHRIERRLGMLTAVVAKHWLTARAAGKTTPRGRPTRTTSRSRTSTRPSRDEQADLLALNLIDERRRPHRGSRPYRVEWSDTPLRRLEVLMSDSTVPPATGPSPPADGTPDDAPSLGRGDDGNEPRTVRIPVKVLALLGAAVAAVLVAVVVVVVSRGPDSPMEVVNDLVAAAEARDLERFESHLCAELREQWREMTAEEQLRSLGDMTRFLLATDWQAVGEEIQAEDGRAAVLVTYTDDNGETVVDSFLLNREDGRWKVCG